VSDLDALVSASDVIVSILVPSAAEDLARDLAAPIRQCGKPMRFVDFNAIAPATMRRIAAILEPAGATVIDGGIIGPPPRRSRDHTRFYLSGAGCEEIAALLQPAVDARALGGAIGDASSVKMCYAALTKGTAALGIQLLTAAERLGVRAHLEAEFRQSRARAFEELEHAIPRGVPKAFRWIGEMEEIAKTFDSVDVTPLGFEGAAETYRDVAGRPIGAMRVEEWAEAGMDLDAVVKALASKD
jgi:3-hydroxyisobutyrate dehydrogenase-like beta-hydroxyacid dehydrogenase